MQILVINKDYPPTASTTIASSFNMSFSIFSIPLFRVNVDDGQPLQAPCITTFTRLVVSSYESNKIFPPSAATAGFTYSSRMLIICCEVVSRLSKFLIFCLSCLESATISDSSKTVPPFSMNCLMNERTSSVISFHS